jgi:hypothetical protein
MSRASLKRRTNPKKGYDEDAAQDWHDHTIKRARQKVAGQVRYVCPGCGKTRSERDMQAHHVVTQEAIRGYVNSLRLPLNEALDLLRRLLWDRRNGLPVCRWCHERHTKAVKRLARSLLDSKAWQFAAELNLERHLTRYYTE